MILEPKTIALEGNAGRPSHKGMGIGEDISFTLNTVDRHGVAYSLDALSSNSMKSDNPNSGCREVDTARTLDTASPCPSKNQGGIAIVQEYAVRRLTPTECARLQGFPDWWGHIEPKSDMTDDEVEFWNEVRKKKAEIEGQEPPKHMSKKQAIKYHNKLYSESAEYKMWGNGVALPTTAAVLGAIAEEIREERQ